MKKGRKKYFCYVCEKEILTGKVDHIKKFHSHKDGNKTCPKCGKTFLKFLLTHQHIMNQHEKIPCATCGEMVGKRMMYLHVQNKHTDNADKKYKCTFCGKGFSKHQRLKEHVNIHTGERPYMCKFCGASFASQGTHRMHERMVHLGHKRDGKDPH